MNDADIEAAALERLGNRSAALRKRGICSHGWFKGPAGPSTAAPGPATCLDCGKVFESTAALIEERASILM